MLSFVSLLGCTQAVDTSDVEVHEEALDIEAGIIKTLYQVEAASGWSFTDREIDHIADSLRKHIDTLPAEGPIGYQEQALLGSFDGAFEDAPTVTVTTNSAFGGSGAATNSGLGGAGASNTGFGSGGGSTYFGSPSTTNTSLNQAVGVVCSEFNNIRVDIGGDTTMCPVDDPTCVPDTEPASVLSVGFGCVAAGSRPVINWAAAGSGEILTVNVSYADIQALSSGFVPSEAWARSRIWQAPVSGGSVVYGGPPLRRDGGLGFLIGIVEVSGGGAVFVAFVI